MSLFRREYYEGTPVGKTLVCPKCKEVLQPADVDEFGVCPYCETPIPTSEELEDYKMLPIVSRWVSRTWKNFSSR